MSAGEQRYLVALGSNVPRHGAPPKVLRDAAAALGQDGLAIDALSPVMTSAPLGPSRRRYANAVALVRTGVAPPQLLALLQAVEHSFGRRRRGARWGPRVLDLDIVLWSGGAWRSPGLTIPHPEFRRRAFVLLPAARLAPRWRDPASGLALIHLAARLTRRTPLPTARPRAGP